MTVNEIPEYLKIVEERINIINNTSFNYETENKFIPSIGYVYEIPNKKECAKALAFVKTKCASQLEAADELGISREEIEADVKYLGYNIDKWRNDIQIRVQEISLEKELSDLNTARALLLKNRTLNDTIIAEIELVTIKLARL